MAITEFKGQYFFLSNFYIPEHCPSGEHLFQAAKATSHADYMKVLAAPTPAVAKRVGRHIELRPDWEGVKERVMAEVVAVKFHHPELRNKLIATGDHELSEGNTWGDTYWGVDLATGEGRNRLGVILMDLREDLRLLL